MRKNEDALLVQPLPRLFPRQRGRGAGGGNSRRMRVLAVLAKHAAALEVISTNLRTILVVLRLVKK